MTTENGTMTVESEREDTSDESKHHLLDDELVEMLESDVPNEDPILTEYMGGGDSGDDRTGTAAAWLPEPDEMKDETFLSPAQAKALAVGRAYDRLFPEANLSPETAVMREIFNDFEKYLVSIHGMGREDQVTVLASMFGKTVGEGSETAENEATISLISNAGDD